MKEHPLPDVGTRLQRILLGATKGPDKKKRTPNQAAEFIVSSFARHFRTSKGLNLGRNLELFSRLLAASEGQNIQIFRATYKSEALWTSLMQILKRNALNSSGPPRMTSLAMHEAMSVLHLSHTIRYKPEYQEHVDILIYNWLTAGLFDALVAVLPAIMNSTTGPSASEPPSPFFPRVLIFLSLSVRLLHTYHDPHEPPEAQHEDSREVTLGVTSISPARSVHDPREYGEPRSKAIIRHLGRSGENRVPLRAARP